MPRVGYQYEIDDAWRDRVRAAMNAMDPKMTDAALAKAVGAGRTAIFDLFNKKQMHSTLAAVVNEAVGLPPPTRLVLADDELTLLQIYRALSDTDRGRVVADATARLRRQSNPDPHGRDVALHQAADVLLENIEDQTDTVQLSSEGSPRSPRTRRASRSR